MHLWMLNYAVALVCIVVALICRHVWKTNLKEDGVLLFLWVGQLVLAASNIVLGTIGIVKGY